MRRSLVGACAMLLSGCSLALRSPARLPVAPPPVESSNDGEGERIPAFTLATTVVMPPPAERVYAPLRLWLGPRRTSRHRPSGPMDVRVDVSLERRELTVHAAGREIFRAPVGVASGLRFAFAGRSWKFQTPRGDRRVLRKTANPVWSPPDWHYAEAASTHNLALERLPAGGVTLRNGARLAVRDRVVGLIRPGAPFAELPIDEHIVFGKRLFIPPFGTLNRRVTGELGRHALDLGDGYLIHGTSDKASIGLASTHGCIRLRPDDLEWLYDNIPTGTVVRIR